MSSLQLTKSEVIHGRINFKAGMKSSAHPDYFDTFMRNRVCIHNLKSLYKRTFAPEGILAGRVFRSTHSKIDVVHEPFTLDYNRPYVRNNAIAGYFVTDSLECVFELDIIADALEYGMGTKGFVTLELIN